MADARLDQVDVYEDNGTRPIDNEMAEVNVALADSESAESVWYVRIAVDVISLIRSLVRAIKALIRSIIRTIKILVGRIKKAIARQGVLTAAAVTGVATAGIGTAISAGLSVLNGAYMAHSLYMIGRAIWRCRRYFVKSAGLGLDLAVDIAGWYAATQTTNQLRELRADVEKRLLAAMLNSAEFKKKTVACKKRIGDHKNAVYKFYTMLVKNDIIPEDDIIGGYCDDHDDDKLENYNLVRQALRFVGENEKPPKGLLKSMMKAVVEEHVHANKHHPEYWSGCTVNDSKQKAYRMPLKYIGEMCADWAAMSEEMGTSLMEWKTKVVNRRWMFTKAQVNLIDKCCEFLDKKTNGGKRDYGYKYYDPGADKAAKSDSVNESINVLGRAVLEGQGSRNDILGAINVLMRMIGDQGGFMDDDDCGMDDDPDVEVADAVVLDDADDESLPDNATDDGMREIMDSMSVPESVRGLAPSLLANVIDNEDGTYSSVDGSVRMDGCDALKDMVGATLNAIFNAVGEDAHSNVSIGEDLSAHVLTRDPNGHRREITVEPVVEEFHE